MHFTDVDTYRVVFFTASTALRVSDIRLPRHLVPEHYRVYLTPFLDLNNFTIQGHVDIQMKVVEADGANITLHVQVCDWGLRRPPTSSLNLPLPSQDMTLFENSIVVARPGTGEPLDVEGFGYDKQRKFFIIYLRQPLVKGQAVTASIDFLGNLNDDLSGFYRSSYYDTVSEARVPGPELRRSPAPKYRYCRTPRPWST